MKSIIWPTILLLTLWVVMVAVLPAWINLRYVPNLILAGVLVLAITDLDSRVLGLVAIFGFFLDVQSSLLIGSYAVGLPVLYMAVHFSFKHFVPSDRIYIALPASYILTELILKVWLYLVGFLASVVGWPVVPLFSLRGGGYTVLSLLIGGLMSFGIYIVWLEVTHRFDKPLRLRR